MIQKEQTDRRVQKLEKTISSKRRALSNAPEGTIRIRTNKGHWQYYWVSPEKPQKQKCLGKKDMALVKRLAQKSYDQKVLRAAEQELKAWRALAMYFPDKTVEEVYETLSPARQALVVPIRPSDEAFRKQWESVKYEPGEFKPGQPVFLTMRGERVRSKSEMLIANLLYQLGIPYRYEYPLEVTVDGRTRYWRPDFTLLDVRDRKEYYLEHFGMLDDQEEERNYARSAFWKMRVYEENGIFEGKNIIYSFETGKAPLDLAYLEMKVRRALHLPPAANRAAT